MDAAARANSLWRQRLERYEAPPLDPGIDEAIDEELRDFMQRRKSEIGEAINLD